MRMRAICLTAWLLCTTTAIAVVQGRGRHVGLLFGSFGDVESCSCVDSYVMSALTHLIKYEIPAPLQFRARVVAFIWKRAQEAKFTEYRMIHHDCNTSFQTHARAQAEAVTAALRVLVPKTTTLSAFTGYNFIGGPGCPPNVTVVQQVCRWGGRQRGVCVVRWQWVACLAHSWTRYRLGLELFMYFNATNALPFPAVPSAALRCLAPQCIQGGGGDFAAGIFCRGIFRVSNSCEISHILFGPCAK